MMSVADVEGRDLMDKIATKDASKAQETFKWSHLGPSTGQVNEIMEVLGAVNAGVSHGMLLSLLRTTVAQLQDPDGRFLSMSPTKLGLTHPW